MLEEEYQPRRRLPRHLRPATTPEPAFTYVIRAAEPSDLPDVRDIHGHYVRNSSVTFDASAFSFAAWKQRYDDVRRRGLPFLVAENPSGQILGYALVTPWNPRDRSNRVVEDSIYLRPASGGKGLGRALLTALLEESAVAGVREVVAVIADRAAEASIRLHASLGFTETGRMARVGYKYERWLGTVTMQLRLRGGRGRRPLA
ncbi:MULTISPECIES: GNAT family N-acetyltransferase [unclassified Curtobacterium]|uniref:GNAT family N-acetyltransferase n=1 Tax=unclassified Curtobacterium TaxID=257496 RepID=UPI000DAA2876|nr:MULTISPECIES: GNAT family N-acetyltransferase [unclassified Curtobacterium]PZE28895.1 N-acetyltransferase [Curtobacterium sp. MCBD17_028]PZE77246.1 N-acetyltransferase [Curtobacterium sp. MCBD17_019]PZF57598.1 N-acetyltransferase [Curtobacterium sp. MCBD17_034]PZM33690.1 N-acetyltransferase [Curtobacterium sp. MCBD17_031]WIB62380.1 N-acetyltransferase family protein [Curtobacterium sp. MCBD17_040]